MYSESYPLFLSLTDCLPDFLKYKWKSCKRVHVSTKCEQIEQERKKYIEDSD